VEPVLTLKNVGFRYGMAWALRGIDLEVNEGELLGILGPNGSGKSTLLKLMDGILVPDEGKILVRGKALSSLGRTSVAREIAMVSQENYFRFEFSVLEVVLMGRFPHLGRFQFEGPKDLDIALNALKATHALDLAERSIHGLSGGEKQRVLIARALAQEPGVVLLDEPTSFLDLKYKREIFRLVSSLSADKGISVVVVSHDIDLVSQYCKRIVMLRGGIVHDSGEPAEVLTRTNIEAVYDCPVLVDNNPVTGKPRITLLG